jgi:Zn-dependent peptidase ImmA (M78 family)
VTLTAEKTDKIERRAHTLLQKAGIRNPAVPIEAVARSINVEVQPANFGDDVSGVLVVTEGHGIIGYNQDHPIVRQRFTIAHEIAHYVLHSDDEDLFIDKKMLAVFRDSRSARGADSREIEANAFAAALLMPATMVKKALAERSFDLGGEDDLSELATLFHVSKQAMSYRLANIFSVQSRPKARSA